MSSGTLTEDGTTTSEVVNGYVWLHADGDFGSGTLSLQYLSADGTYRTINGYTLTADGDLFVNLPNPTTVQLDLTGSTAASLFYEINHGFRK